MKALTPRQRVVLWVFAAAAPYAGEPREGGEGEVAFDVLPGGRVVTATHRGPPEGVAHLSTKLDAYILVTTSSGAVRPMTGDGGGVFTSGPVVPTGTSPGPNAIAAVTYRMLAAK